MWKCRVNAGTWYRVFDSGDDNSIKGYAIQRKGKVVFILTWKIKTPELPDWTNIGWREVK